jgi:hydrogenase/urease accessory protein HupE
VTGWTLAKYALALAGLALVIGAERIGRPWVGYIGLGLLVAAFALRFVQRRVAVRSAPSHRPQD